MMYQMNLRMGSHCSKVIGFIKLSLTQKAASCYVFLLDPGGDTVVDGERLYTMAVDTMVDGETVHHGCRHSGGWRDCTPLNIVHYSS